jgi:hypothetical protein
LVKAYQHKPVKFLAVLANATLTEASAYQIKNRLMMPIYPDSLGLMQKRYGFKISLSNIWQFRVVGPDGKVIVLKEDGDKWKSEADAAAMDDPVKAYDLFSRVAAVFAGTALGNSAQVPLKKLSVNKKVSSELAARKAFNALKASLTRLTPARKQLAVKHCRDITRKYPNTPTGDQAAELLKELE